MQRTSSSASESTFESDRVLEALGITPDEELLYRTLLREGSASIAELTRRSGRSRRTTELAMRRLQSTGLVSQTLGKRGQFFAPPPSQALEILFLQREEELRRARIVADRLIEEVHLLHPVETPKELVEVVMGGEELNQRFDQLQRSAQTEVLILDTPPYVSANQNEVEVELLARGIRFRVIYAREALEYPHKLDVIDEIVALGEEGRLVDTLPMKLAIADRKLGLVPLTLTGPADVIAIHASPLLEALIVLFESLWARAAPIRLSPESKVEFVTGGSDLISSDDQRLLLLLAADMKEEMIGRQLGISRRTVQRRARDLMDRFGVRTRLQLVLEAARRDLV